MAHALSIAVVVGLGLGICFQKGRFCFVNAFRDFFAYRDARVTKGVVAATLLTMAGWSVAYELGHYQGFWTPSWGATGLVGGFVFGVGMTYAGGCATGTLYRAGQGYVHFWLTLLSMGLGYVLFALAFPTLRSRYFGPLQFGAGVTLFDAAPLPAPAVALLVVAGSVAVYAMLVGGLDPVSGLGSLVAGARAYLAGFARIDDPIAATRRPWDPRTAALGITGLAIVWFAHVSIVGITGPEARWTGWFLRLLGVDVHRIEYWGSILFRGRGVRVTTDMVMVACIVAGSFLAAVWSGDFTVRVPKRRRVPNAVGGGFLMGAGSRLAPGCNVGNVYSGLAELSLHSVVATLGIVVGVYVMTHWLYRDVGCAI